MSTPLSPPSWAYFYRPPEDSRAPEACGLPNTVCTLYRVEEVHGDAPLWLSHGMPIGRFESKQPMKLAQPPLWQGVTQHLLYTSHEQRGELLAKSRPDLPPGPDSIAVLIPIRKSPAWWSLAQDERQAYFAATHGERGHTAIGLGYADQIYRRLYHARYLAGDGCDFLTYFEFERSRTEDFRRLLAALRDVERNPEWQFVDREYEVWMDKVDELDCK